MSTLKIKLSAAVFLTACQDQSAVVPDAAIHCRQDCEDLVICTIDSRGEDGCSCRHELSHEWCVADNPGTICAPRCLSDGDDEDCYYPALIHNKKCLSDDADEDCYYPIEEREEGSGCHPPNTACTLATEKTDCPPLVGGCLFGRCDAATNLCLYQVDADGDGYASLACRTSGDCDDTRPNVHPDRGECLDGLDNDCDGLIDNTRDRFDCYTSDTNSPSGRRGHTAVWTGSEMVVWGGNSYPFGNCANENELYELFGNGGKYAPLTDTWFPTSVRESPSARFNHTAVWTGSEMIVWGGGVSSNLCLEINTGSRYNPADDFWVPTSMENAPSPRYGHTAVWTGSEMIVWGAANTRLYRDSSGARYDPGRDVWIPVRTEGAPACGEHTAVWTGSEMIVWGCGETYNLGGKYDPINNQWIPTAVFGAPSGRWVTTAVWADDCDKRPGRQGCMIIWGGHPPNWGDVPNFGTGAMYFPDENRWQNVSNVNAPVGRAWHTAIWTGSEMIVWGGLGNDAGGTGGRYSPISNRWESTPTPVSAVIPRYDHTAIWTGSEMIVWGGVAVVTNYFGVLWCGARYAP